MMPVCLPRNKSRVCSSEWHVLAPPPPAAALRCWVEAQQPGERSSNFAAATLVSPVPSHLFVKRTESASFPNSRVLRWRPNVAVCVLGLCRWDYFMCVCVFPSAPDDRVFGSRRWARLKWLAGEDKGVECRPAVPSLPVRSTWSSCKFGSFSSEIFYTKKKKKQSNFVCRWVPWSPRAAAAFALLLLHELIDHLRTLRTCLILNRL